MRKPSVRCALLAALLAKHRWGTPIDREHLLAVSAIEPNDYPTARQVFDDLRYESFIVARGDSISLNPSRFGALAAVLHDECGWEPYQIRSRLKHYEGWDNHDWA